MGTGSGYDIISEYLERGSIDRTCIDILMTVTGINGAVIRGNRPSMVDWSNENHAFFIYYYYSLFTAEQG